MIRECYMCGEEIYDTMIYVCDECESAVCSDCYDGGILNCPECDGNLGVVDTEEEDDF